MIPLIHSIYLCIAATEDLVLSVIYVFFHARRFVQVFIKFLYCNSSTIFMSVILDIFFYFPLFSIISLLFTVTLSPRVRILQIGWTSLSPDPFTPPITIIGKR